MMSTLPFDQRACFIAGQAKSGTTLVATLLDGHPELLVLPQETAYFPTVLRKYRGADRRTETMSMKSSADFRMQNFSLRCAIRARSCRPKSRWNKRERRNAFRLIM